jgi:hypothetical protein
MILRQHKPEWMKIIGFFGFWLLAEALLMMLEFTGRLPQAIGWIVWAPVAVILFTIIISGLLIFLSYVSAVRRFWSRHFEHQARIGHKTITRCDFCPYAIRKDNPVNRNMPIHKCEENGMRLILNAQKVPGWCPHVLR